MAARDVFHAAVRQALMTDGWTITHDPLFVALGGVDRYIDLGAEKLIGAERDGRQSAVEVKSFLGPSLVSDFHAARGQFLNYHLALAAHHPTRMLYLAVPVDADDTFFMLPFPQAALAHYHVHLIVYDPQQQEITQWILGLKQDSPCASSLFLKDAPVASWDYHNS